MGEISVPEAPVRMRLWPVLTAVALLAAGAWAVTRWPLAGAAAFVLAALTLLWARPAGAPAFGGVDLPTHPRQPWEIGFVVLLLVLGAYSRLWDLNDTPQGAVTYEGEMRQDLSALSTVPYTPHSRHSINRWPTLLHYQALGMGKAFDFELWALRFPSAVWGLLSLLVFYLLARRLTSPASAAVASLFYAGSFLDILYARRVFPGTILHFSVMATLLSILQAARLRREGRPAGLALAIGGICLGLGMHAYYPGRSLPLLFALWFLWIWACGGHRPLGAKQQGALWAAAALVAAPVVIWAWQNPVDYWGWIQHMNPNREAGLPGYLRSFWGNLPEYLKMFHIAGDMLWEDNVGRLPLLDPVAGALFAAGLFMGLLFFWRPLPAFLLGLSIAALLPAILGGGFPHPNSRRAILVTPAVYLFIGLAAHQLLVLARLGSAWLGRAALLLLLALGAWSFSAGVHKTFVRFYQDPNIRADYNHMGWLAGKEIRRHPDAKVLTSQMLRDGFSQAIFFPRGGPDQILNDHEELLALEPLDHMILLEPFLVEAVPLLKAVFPNVEWKVFDGRPPDATGQLDPYERRVWLISGFMTAADIQATKGWLDASGRPAGTNTDGFGAAHAGREVDLRARLYLPEGAPRSLTFVLDWPEATLSAKTRRISLGRAESFTGGWHNLRLRAKVPANARGPLPFKIMVNGRDIAPAAVVNFDWPYGMDVSYFESRRTWGKGQLAFVRRELLPIRRYWDPMWLKLHFSARAEAVLRVPGSGDYRFRVPISRDMGRVMIDGREVSSNLVNRDTDTSIDIRMNAGQAYRLTVDVDPDPQLTNRNFALEVRRPGETEWISIPPQWLTPGAE